MSALRCDGDREFTASLFEKVPAPGIEGRWAFVATFKDLPMRGVNQPPRQQPPALPHNDNQIEIALVEENAKLTELVIELSRLVVKSAVDRK